MAARGFVDLSVLFRAADWLAIPYEAAVARFNEMYGDPGSLEAEAARLRTVQSNIADAGELLADNLYQLKNHWRGDACAAFEAYVTRVAARLDHLNALIDKVAEQLLEAASNIAKTWSAIGEAANAVIAGAAFALATAPETFGLSVVAAAGVVATALYGCAQAVGAGINGFDGPRQQIAAARAELDLWSAGGAIRLFGGSSIDNSEWVPQ